MFLAWLASNWSATVNFCFPLHLVVVRKVEGLFGINMEMLDLLGEINLETQVLLGLV